MKGGCILHHRASFILGARLPLKKLTQIHNRFRIAAGFLTCRVLLFLPTKIPAVIFGTPAAAFRVPNYYLKKVLDTNERFDIIGA
tara:strand:+ start:30 stop:284 length:255 start_codon:yes stop_codon:yes gene_type:complete